MPSVEEMLDKEGKKLIDKKEPPETKLLNGEIDWTEDLWPAMAKKWFEKIHNTIDPKPEIFIPWPKKDDEKRYVQYLTCCVLFREDCLRAGGDKKTCRKLANKFCNSKYKPTEKIVKTFNKWI